MFRKWNQFHQKVVETFYDLESSWTHKLNTECKFLLILKIVYLFPVYSLADPLKDLEVSNKISSHYSAGDLKKITGKEVVEVNIDKEAKTITISDNGIGMTAEEVDKYINQIAFSGATEFLDKYKDDDAKQAIIGHFGLGFYSSFMVSERVDIITKSQKPKSKAVKWSCDGSPEYTIENIKKDTPCTSYR